MSEGKKTDCLWCWRAASRIEQVIGSPPVRSIEDYCMSCGTTVIRCRGSIRYWNPSTTLWHDVPKGCLLILNWKEL